MLFRVASILVACTASEAIAPAIAPERSLKRKLAKTPPALQKMIDFFDETIPFEMKGHKVVKELQKLGGFGAIVPKILAGTVALTILGEPTFVLLEWFVRTPSTDEGGWARAGRQFCFWWTAAGLISMDALGIWKLKALRMKYIIMTSVVAVTAIWMSLEDYGYGPLDKYLYTTSSGYWYYPAQITYTSINFVVATFNYVKTLLPVVLSLWDEIESKVKN